jgi:hypothetical protein
LEWHVSAASRSNERARSMMCCDRERDRLIRFDLEISWGRIFETVVAAIHRKKLVQ